MSGAVRHRRRIWSELVPLDLLTGDRTLLDALARRGIQLIVAVQPAELEVACRLVREAGVRGLSIGVWPLLDDVDGRWLHTSNATRFESWARALWDELGASGLSVDTVVLDLEPPIDAVRSLTDGHWSPLARGFGRASDDSVHRRLVALFDTAEILATAIPPATLPGPAGLGWQRALGTPLGLPYTRVSAMLYTSLFEGYSGGWLRRCDARSLLSYFAESTRRTFGTRAAVSLGSVGPGALGDERPFRSVEELRDDMALVMATGIDDLALFDLAGVLRRPPLESWLDALVTRDTLSRGAAPTVRAVACSVALEGGGCGLAALWRLADALRP